ncbi:MAG TPA: cell division ATP-binding protein FtsE [Methylococcaceae bacterium]|jgi:cell division transport system ATP-binding protein|nr:cell division ATP-binding protein FtsE [Methylococcaceae bacterium]HIN69420.1 cell division ATP-binding protein FtsE [Methylococcales bacterium]HIA46255.1 cell division ATP-binding protein FtsE [Methylococcaceae bacterium]HIB62749.1 cell division ATP-binding protein FtsE [Methylococcaceae bacterium]HIO12351.1 cell division ATP-binding protein FtsE [Methylococcales bacterium]
MIKFDRVSKGYAEVSDALVNVSFTIGKGEMVFLTGRSGAGKSTLLKLIALVETVSRGQVFLDGQNLNRVSQREIPFIRRKIGLIFQDYKLLNDRTVADNIALPLLVAGYNHQDIKRRVRAVLDKVGLVGKEKSYPLSLSGGEQQRVGIARAVVNKPSLILADEPTGNLDPELSTEIICLFKQFKQVGVTVFVATHDLTQVVESGCRQLILDRGRLVSG